jgi:hypothetical protein
MGSTSFAASERHVDEVSPLKALDFYSSKSYSFGAFL